MTGELHLTDRAYAITAEQELARVMAEICAALGGTSAALTLHPAEQPASLVYAGPADDLQPRMAELLAAGALDWEQDHPDHHIWVSGEFAPHAPHAIALPVRRVPGHGRLVITVFFDTLDAERRAAAEAAYLDRRPFAVGYFRLWQQDRVHRRDVDTLRAALDRFGIAVMLVTKGGEVAFKNEAARKLLDIGDGLSEQRRRLRARGRADDRALEDAIDEAIDAGEGDDARKVMMLSVQREDVAPLMISVVPSPVPVVEQGEIAAMVFTVDPAMDIRELARPVCDLFGLTRVEAELACLLAAGETLGDAADAIRVKRETARGYLRSMFNKTGVNRQADLIRMILLNLVRVSESLRYAVVN